MSTAPRFQPHYTVADYAQWEGEWELWNGTAVSMSPSPQGPHERVVSKLVFQIETCVAKQQCPCASYAGLDWIVNDDTVVRPDVMIVCGKQPGRYLEHAPVVAVEVLSASTENKDRTVKRSLYEAEGVRHYLLIDPVAQTIEWLALGEDRLYQDQTRESLRMSTLMLPLADGCEIELTWAVTFA